MCPEEFAECKCKASYARPGRRGRLPENLEAKTSGRRDEGTGSSGMDVGATCAQVTVFTGFCRHVRPFTSLIPHGVRIDERVAASYNPSTLEDVSVGLGRHAGRRKHACR